VGGEGQEWNFQQCVIRVASKRPGGLHLKKGVSKNYFRKKRTRRRTAERGSAGIRNSYCLECERKKWEH